MQSNKSSNNCGVQPPGAGCVVTQVSPCAQVTNAGHHVPMHAGELTYAVLLQVLETARYDKIAGVRQAAAAAASEMAAIPDPPQSEAAVTPAADADRSPPRRKSLTGGHFRRSAGKPSVGQPSVPKDRKR